MTNNQIIYFYTMDFSHIRLATENDITDIALLFKKVTDVMVSNGIHQWNYTYPLAVHIAHDIQNQSAFVFEENGQIAGTITLNTTQDRQYSSIHWNIYDLQPLVIHRLAVHHDFQRMGISKKLCFFAEKVAEHRLLKSVRLDAYSGNYVSNLLYLSLGYKRANGNCYFHKNVIPFYCYDKILKSE